MRATDPTPRFESAYRVCESTGCWIWCKAKSVDGYGRIRAWGKPCAAHRLSWELFNGVAIPAGMCVLHRCDTPACVNPEHLFIGSNDDNIADKVAKGRQTIGQRNGRAKISDAQAREIKALIDRGERHDKIAKLYGIGRTTVGNISTGIQWAHATGETA